MTREKRPLKLGCKLNTLIPAGVFPGLAVVVLPKRLIPELAFNFFSAGFNI
ncbi:hypothetical protein HanRHA438_Chr08g0352461 [Helianthus annuus]|nr:hypothetical protein HanIR_Chr08g0368251 [Helianthus annuus]KAJ0898049.1 hypothetical protein HanRHA438_Chr08g0352461 [Helianthus annuus]